MFLHLYTYRLKCLLRDKPNIFWTLLFPILLASLFHFAFSNLMSEKTMAPIPVAVVEDQGWENDDGIFTAFMNEISTGDNPVISLTLGSPDETLSLLENNQVDGVIQVDETIHLKVKTSGLNQTIIKSLLDHFIQNKATITAIIATNPQAISQGLLDEVNNPISWTQEKPMNGSAQSSIIISYYALIAMACLYGSFWGLRDINDLQGNLSPRGARVNLSPVPKPKMYLANSLASLTVHFSEILILIAFMFFVLGIDFGNRIGLVALTCFAGSLTGITFGSCVSVLVKKSEGIKTAVLIASTMFMSFLAGLMVADVKYYIAENFPILAVVNPASAITDALYSLYYYSGTTEFFINIGILCVMTFIFGGITWFMIRREKYASL